MLVLNKHVRYFVKKTVGPRLGTILMVASWWGRGMQREALAVGVILSSALVEVVSWWGQRAWNFQTYFNAIELLALTCLLYTSDAADD